MSFFSFVTTPLHIVYDMHLLVRNFLQSQNVSIRGAIFDCNIGFIASHSALNHFFIKMIDVTILLIVYQSRLFVNCNH